jgi:hypothetical protein
MPTLIFGDGCGVQGEGMGHCFAFWLYPVEKRKNNRAKGVKKQGLYIRAWDNKNIVNLGLG